MKLVVSDIRAIKTTLPTEVIVIPPDQKGDWLGVGFITLN